MTQPASQSAPTADLAGTGALSSSRTRLLPATGGVTSPEDADRAMQDVARGGTSVDTALGRLVIDYGLATAEEVQHVQDTLKSGSRAGGATAEEDSGQSLARALVDQEFVTKRQIARLKQILDAERSGQKIPGYKVLGKLGAGAMATVYKAKQLNLDRLVAIKVLPRKFSANSQFIERFYAEGRAAAQLNHPNIVQAYDVGKAGEYHYFVMEFVDGRTVYDDIVKHKRYPEAEAIEIAMQVAEALDHAHSRGLIHRDVKPKNIMIGHEGVVKLADMGLARAISDKEAAEAESGKAFGTPYYISPEQIRGETAIGAPADIYSLGATLYHMVTGSVPFDGKNPSSVMHKHLKASPAPPDQVNPRLSAGISEVIEMMMSKRPADRYQNCRDLLSDLRAVRAGDLPPLAHRDLGADALVSLASGEAAAASQIVEDTSGVGQFDFRTPLLAALGVALAISVIVNFALWLAG